MQARPKIIQVFVVALIVSLVVGACGGGTTGSTWFNLPSAKLRIQPDGSARIWGLSPGIFLPANLIQQLQSADIQELEVRTGNNGIHVYSNGQHLPFIQWDQESVETLQEILPQLGTVPNADTIASLLPWLRTIGMGVLLDLPLAEGSTELDIARWNGETDVSSETPEELTVGPITIGSLTFDPEGNASIEGVPVSELEQSLGTPLPIVMPPMLENLLGAMGTEALNVNVNPNGIDFRLGDQPLPSIAYDTDSMNTLVGILPAFVADPALVDTITQAVPILLSTELTVDVSLTGEQTTETELTPIEVSLSPEGDAVLFGFPIAQGVLDPAMIENLQTAGVQRLTVNLTDNGLFISANDQLLPSITWDDASLESVIKIAGPLSGLGEAGLQSILDIATGIAPNIAVNLPLAEGIEALELLAPADMPQEFGAIDAGSESVTLRLTVGVDDAGNLTSIGGFTAEQLGQLGVSLPTLPTNIVELLDNADASTVMLNGAPGAMIISLDGEEVIRIAYDQASLLAALDIAAPFAADTMLANPAIDSLLREQVLPLIPNADVDVTVNLP